MNTMEILYKIWTILKAIIPITPKDRLKNAIQNALINMPNSQLKGNITINQNTYLEKPKEAIIIGELCITKTCKRLVIKNIGDVDAQNIDFVCSELDALLISNERKKFPIKSLPAKTSISVRVLFLTRSPSMYEVEWIYEDSNRNKIIKKQTIIK